MRLAAPLSRSSPRPDGIGVMVFGVGIFSLIGNLLLLVGPLYMLQIYDRVLMTRSIETLVGLTIIAFFLLLIWGVVDFCRGRILARLGSEFRSKFDRQIGLVSLNKGDRFQDESRKSLIQWAESVERVTATPLGAALADILWVPIFLAGLAMFHSLLCGMACVGIAGVVVLHRISHWIGQDITEELQVHASCAKELAAQLEATHSQSIQYGLQRNLWRHWHDMRQQAGMSAAVLSDRKGGFESLLRTWKLCLQSAILGLGAFLVVDGALSPGAMIASTILMLRALGPVDVLAQHWPMLVDALQCSRNIRNVFERTQPNQVDLGSLAPNIGENATSLCLATRQKAGLGSVEIALDPGDVLGVIGASGAGKSQFLAMLFSADVVAPSNSRDGKALAQSKALCDSAVYLGASPQVYPGTIAQNISGFRCEARGADIKNAALLAGIDQEIEALDFGYASDVTDAMRQWPAAVQYRLSLSSAIFEAPPLLLLDDPFAEQPPSAMHYITHLLEARTVAKQTTIFTARHPTALGVCQKLLWLEDGQCRAFGPRDAVLARFLAPRATQEPATGMDMAS